MSENDWKITLLKTAVDSLIKYGLQPKLAKKRKRRQFSKAIKNKVLRRQNYICNGCTNPLDVVEFDHINGNPFDNHHLNCQALCPICHAKKTRLRRKLKIRHFY